MDWLRDLSATRIIIAVGGFLVLKVLEIALYALVFQTKR